MDYSDIGAIHEHPQFPDWMSQLPKKLHSVPLNHIAIPGSHDSTTFHLDGNLPLVAGSSNGDKCLQALFKCTRKVSSKFFRNWSRTQSLNYEEQLQAGIRYFDMRVATLHESEDLYLVHRMYSYKVEEMVSSVNQYLQDHPKEVVFLDINHLINMSGRHEYLLNMLKTIFGSKICPRLDMDKVNLNTLWENGFQVLIFYHNEAADDDNLFWPGSKIPSPWANTANPDCLVNYLENHYGKDRDNNSFHVTQGVLTPVAATILKHLCSDLKSVLSIPGDSNFVKWLKGKKSGEKCINICIADFVESSDYIPTLMQLNQDLARE